MEKIHGQVEKTPRLDSFKKVPPGMGTVHLDNGFGNGQRFFLCPRCGARVRFLYRTTRDYLCRRCAHLNYRSQQVTRTDMYDYFRAMAIARLRLGAKGIPAGVRFEMYVPPKPAGMHRATYDKLVSRFQWYKGRHLCRQWRIARRLSYRP